MTIRERIEAAMNSDRQGDLARLLQHAWFGAGLIPADEVDARIEAAVAAERERCAEIADREAAKRNFVGTHMHCVFIAENIATAIREQNHDK